MPGSSQDPAYKFTIGLLCSTILAARLASVEAQQDQAAATDVDGWSSLSPSVCGARLHPGCTSPWLSFHFAALY